MKMRLMKNRTAKPKKSKMLKLVLITLVLVLAVLSANSEIASALISSASISGKDKVDSYAGADDIYTITVDASLNDGSEVKRTNLKIGSFSVNFDSCQLVSQALAKYRCSYTDTGTTRDLLNPVNTFSIRLVNNAGVTEDSKDVTLYTDGLKPEISSFFIVNGAGAQATRVSSNPRIVYDLKDKACTVCGNLCSGVSNISVNAFTIRNNTLNTLQNSSVLIHSGFVSQNSQCRLSILNDPKTSSVSLTQGNYTFCLNVSDKVRLTSKKCVNASVDSKKPSIITGSASFFESGKKVTKYFGTPIRGVLTINISDEDDLAFNSVVADLSKISTGGENNAQGTCIVLGVQGSGKKSCSWQFSLALSSSSDPSSREITIKASDIAGNTASETFAFSLTPDNSKPRIFGFRIERSITSLGDTANIIDYINAPTSAKIKINITDDGFINMNSVTANLSVFGLSSAAKPDSCTFPWNRTMPSVCEWDVLLNFNQTKNGNVIIRASDILNNNASGSFSFTVKVDKIAPKVTALGTLVKFKDNYYASWKRNNTFIARVIESDSGFDNQQVFLDLSQINGFTRVRGNCTKINDGSWNCFWRNVNVTAQAVSTISLNIMDDAGNSGVGNITSRISIDSQPPQLLGFSYKCFSQDLDLTDFCKEGDLLNIEVKVSDSLPSSVVANLSAFGGLGKSLGKCVSSNFSNPVITSCNFTVEGINKSVLYNRPVFFYISDISGNKKTEQKFIPVLMIDNRTVSDFWTSTFTRSPNFIDRQTTSFINHRAYVHVFLSPIQGDTEILSLKSQGCSGDTQFLNGGSAGANFNAEFYNNLGKNPRDPFYKLTLETANIPGSLHYSCSMLIVSRVGTKIVSTETETINLDIPVYDLSVGELSGKVEKEIKDTEKKVKDTQWIGDIQNIISIANKICSLIGIYRTLVHAYATFSATLDYLRATPAYSFAEFNKKQSSIMDEHFYHNGIVKTASKYCAYISCDEGLIWGKWYKEMIQSSKSTFDWAEKMRFNCQLKLKAGKDQGGFFQNTEGQIPKDKDYEQSCGATIWPNSPKESIVLSAATGCIPGILYNLEKQRQIDCAYLLCLKKEVPNGVPLEACKSQKEYASCKYFYGQVFQVLPFGNFFQGLSNQIKTVVQNPVGLIFGVINYQCELQTTNMATSICVWGKTIPELGKLVNLFDSFKDTLNWKVNGDVCKEALK